MTLIVAETFYSLQCEGRAIGTPAVFLRLAGCNLLCTGSWICDTIEVWKRGRKTEFEDVLSAEYITRLLEGAHLVITGGEPLLHQENVVKYIKWLKQTYEFNPIIEVETNGTILPSATLQQWVTYWNVSPKLANSGEPFEKRVNEVALMVFNKLKSIFKFVISKEDDVLEVLEGFGSIVNMKKVMLMPAGATRDELDKVRPLVVEQCKKLGLRYSERLHIVIWNQKTGV